MVDIFVVHKKEDSLGLEYASAELSSLSHHWDEELVVRLIDQPLDIL